MIIEFRSSLLPEPAVRAAVRTGLCIPRRRRTPSPSRGTSAEASSAKPAGTGTAVIDKVAPRIVSKPSSAKDLVEQIRQHDGQPALPQEGGDCDFVGIRAWQRERGVYAETHQFRLEHRLQQQARLISECTQSACVTSAGSWQSGCARSKAGNARQLPSTSHKRGKSSSGSAKRRALWRSGTRHTSARVTSSPTQ